MRKRKRKQSGKGKKIYPSRVITGIKKRKKKRERNAKSGTKGYGSIIIIIIIKKRKRKLVFLYHLKSQFIAMLPPKDQRPKAL